MMLCLCLTVMASLSGISLIDAQAASENELRQLASRTITWRDSSTPANPIGLQLLAINDFHSQMTAGLSVGNRPVGSAPVLAAYLKAAQARFRGHTFLLHAGDHVGASPPESALLQDEPGIMFFNMLGNDQCRSDGRYGEDCNLLGVPGNHELDEGMHELQRLIHGGNHVQGPYLQDPYKGATFPYICANMVQERTGLPVFLPYIIRQVDGVPVGFIGAILHQAASFVPPESLEGIKVLDEADTINLYVRKLQTQGVHTIVAVMHQGGYQQPAREISTRTNPLAGDITPLVKRLDDEVDVVFTGHTHTFHNILTENENGKKMLVVQAWPKGSGYADVQLEISRTSGDVVALSSQVLTTWADQGPGLQPDSQVAILMNRVEEMGSALAEQVIANVAQPIIRQTNEAGESALGNLVADAQRHAMGTDFAFMQIEGLQADIVSGDITKRDQYTVQPANLNLIKLELTGQQIYDLLNQQWESRNDQGRVLQVSGLSYTWDASKPPGQRIVAIMKDKEPLHTEALYTVTVNEYLINGGGHFTVLSRAANPVIGPFVADVLHQYVQQLPQPLKAEIDGRICRLH
jgi:5'-nucleotidase